MKKIFCLFAFMFALTPSFAQNEENRDSVTISNFYKELEAQKVTEICGVKFGTSMKMLNEFSKTNMVKHISIQNNPLFSNTKIMLA